MTGFLMPPNAADLPHGVPLHASTFARMILLHSIDPEPRLSDLVPQVPFAFVYSPVRNSPDTLSNYPRPSMILTDKSPGRWLFRSGRRSITSNGLAGLGFSLVEEAKPVE
jgi:hypothetical protein